MCLCVLKNIVVLSYIYIRATIFHVELRNCHVFMRSQKHRGVKLWIYIDIDIYRYTSYNIPCRVSESPCVYAYPKNKNMVVLSYL